MEKLSGIYQGVKLTISVDSENNEISKYCLNEIEKLLFDKYVHKKTETNINPDCFIHEYDRLTYVSFLDVSTNLKFVMHKDVYFYIYKTLLDTNSSIDMDTKISAILLSEHFWGKNSKGEDCFRLRLTEKRHNVRFGDIKYF